MIKKERYKIAYVTSRDPSDATNSSGVYFFQKKSMQEFIGEIETIGPVYSSSIELLSKLLRKLFKYSSKKYKQSKLIKNLSFRFHGSEKLQTY